MRPEVIVIAPDRLFAPGVREAGTQLAVQEHGVLHPIERSKERILLRLAGVDIGSRATSLARPFLDCPAGEGAAIVADDASGFAIAPRQRVEFACPPNAQDTGVAGKAQLIAVGVIIDRQDAELGGGAAKPGWPVSRQVPPPVACQASSGCSHQVLQGRLVEHALGETAA